LFCAQSLSVEGKEAKIQIEARGEDRVAVYPPNGTERSAEPCYYNMDDSFDSLRNLKAEEGLMDMLINSLEGLHKTFPIPLPCERQWAGEA